MITPPQYVIDELRLKLNWAKDASDEEKDRILTETFAELDRWMPRIQFTYPMIFKQDSSSGEDA